MRRFTLLVFVLGLSFLTACEGDRSSGGGGGGGGGNRDAGPRETGPSDFGPLPDGFILSDASPRDTGPSPPDGGSRDGP